MINYSKNTHQIPQEDKILALRIVTGNDNGNFESIRENSIRSFCGDINDVCARKHAMRLTNVRLGWDRYFRVLIRHREALNNLRILLLEVDKNTLDSESEYEICFSCANILSVFDKDTFMDFCKKNDLPFMQGCFNDIERVINATNEAELDARKRESFINMVENLKRSGVKLTIPPNNWHKYFFIEK